MSGKLNIISKHISYAEAVKSQTANRFGIENIPTKKDIKNMKHIAKNIFEPVRRDVANGKPLFISSFFRSESLNAICGGSITSQHCKGEAMDIDADYFGNCRNRDVFEFIRDNLAFDQLVWEFGDDKNPAWVHVSLSKKNRREVLKSIRKGSKIQYYKI
ncbi:MAG: hypothetical protein IMY73_02280 [Bacteroidetes bacterium]|nr:hypothetical protein [Bacteroidota bacterium]